MIEEKEKKTLFRRKKKKKDEEMLRIEQLEKLMAETGGDVDPDTLVSMYVPHRRRKRLAAALLRMDKLSLWFLGLLLAVAALFITAFMQEKMGNFTINLDRLELFRKGIAIDADPYFSQPTARLTAATVADAPVKFFSTAMRSLIFSATSSFTVKAGYDTFFVTSSSDSRSFTFSFTLALPKRMGSSL